MFEWSIVNVMLVLVGLGNIGLGVRYLREEWGSLTLQDISISALVTVVGGLCILGSFDCFI